MKRGFVCSVVLMQMLAFGLLFAQEPAKVAESTKAQEIAKPEDIKNTEYTVGVDDLLDISVLQPEQLLTSASVAPDGTINFPYIGNVLVKGLTLSQIQDLIQSKLADGYMKYPVVSVSLKEGRSKKFFIYGEVIRPGTYLIEDKTTVLKAISMAGGFTKYGSSSRVKILRPKKDESGYETIKINVGAVMSGNSKADVYLEPQDIMVVSEGVF